MSRDTISGINRAFDRPKGAVSKSESSYMGTKTIEFFDRDGARIATIKYSPIPGTPDFHGSIKHHQRSDEP
jgi:hypothetical protein